MGRWAAGVGRCNGSLDGVAGLEMGMVELWTSIALGMGPHVEDRALSPVVTAFTLPLCNRCRVREWHYVLGRVQHNIYSASALQLFLQVVLGLN